MKSTRIWSVLIVIAALGVTGLTQLSAQQGAKKAAAPATKAVPATKGAPATKAPAAPAAKPVAAKPVEKAADKPAGDGESNRWWNQWAGAPTRNNVPVGKNIPA